MTNSNSIQTPKKIGLLGGGQLARMLALECHRLGLVPYVLCQNRLEPAAQVTSNWIEGDPQNPEHVEKFVSLVDFVTFESEFSPDSVLSILTKKDHVFPKAPLMSLFQKRLTQKQTLVKFGLPTSPFLPVTTAEDLKTAWKKFGPFVLKANFGGYDGNGTHYAKTEKDLAELNTLLNQNTSWMAEKKVTFQKELALMFVRGVNGECFHLPLTETSQKASRCDWVTGPQKNRQLSSFCKKFSVMLKKIDYVGTIGVELFLENGKLLINEVAPRVHNSGHYSQDFLSESQFALHLKAGLGHSLHEPSLLAKSFVMINLLGETGTAFNLDRFSGQVHWYGKTESRAGRKMGHVNYLGGSSKTLLKKALSERKRSLK